MTLRRFSSLNFARNIFYPQDPNFTLKRGKSKSNRGVKASVRNNVWLKRYDIYLELSNESTIE